MPAVVAAPDCPLVAAHLPLRLDGFVSRIECWQCGVRCFHWREAVLQWFAAGLARSGQLSSAFPVVQLRGCGVPAFFAGKQLLLFGSVPLICRG